ncbi:hypothetical protein [Salinispora arenicola]|uniref:hypothetical protein n=1 Tax=Salinispora arenicola TaxID=168697 RepID=UPI000375599D|nr:hypothetical protein [Salinispora arenicola]
MVGDLRREYGYTREQIGRLGHQDLAEDIAGLSPQSAFVAVVGDARRSLDTPAEAQQFIDQFL